MTIENTDLDLKVHVLHYASKLLVHVRLLKFVYFTSQLRHSLVVHTLQKLLDLPLHFLVQMCIILYSNEKTDYMIHLPNQFLFYVNVLNVALVIRALKI